MPREEAAQASRTPDYIVRAPDPHKRGRWVTLGAAWEKPMRDGQVCYSVRLNTLPVGNTWDGTLMLVPPFDNEDESQEN